MAWLGCVKRQGVCLFYYGHLCDMAKVNTDFSRSNLLHWNLERLIQQNLELLYVKPKEGVRHTF